MGRPGRKVGYVMSEESKDKIRFSRTGQKHDRETKDKIQTSIQNYWLSSRSKYHFKKLKNKVGTLHHNYKGRYTDKQGYVIIYIEEERRHEYEHRIVAEQMLGRKLRPNEVVHHLDFNKANNEPENLLVMDRTNHLILHQRLKQSVFKGYDYMGNYVSYEYQLKPIKFKTIKRR